MTFLNGVYQHIGYLFASTSYIIFATRAEMQADTRSPEGKGGAQLVLQVTLIPEMQSLWIIDEEDEGWRVDLRQIGRAHV